MLIGLMISQRSRYALKALIRLARAPKGESIPARDIARTEGIPHAFLEQILLDLKRLKLIDSRRGKDGGYTLAISPSQITLADILRIVDGPVAPLSCLSKTAYRRCEDCVSEQACALRHIFIETHGAMLAVLEKRTLASAIATAEAVAASGNPEAFDIFQGADI
jgi:Rrf2 family protein